MFCPSWSPDDSRILCGVGDDRPGIWSMRATDGSDRHRLTDDARDVPLGYSPDGTQVAFIRTADFPTQGGAVVVFALATDGSAPDIYTAKTNGADLRQVTNTPDTEFFSDWG